MNTVLPFPQPPADLDEVSAFIKDVLDTANRYAISFYETIAALQAAVRVMQLPELDTISPAEVNRKATQYFREELEVLTGRQQ